MQQITIGIGDGMYGHWEIIERQWVDPPFRVTLLLPVSISNIYNLSIRDRDVMDFLVKRQYTQTITEVSDGP